MIVENDGINYEICYSQWKIMDDIRFILRTNNPLQTIDGDQVYFKIKCGELTFRVSVEKTQPDPKLCNPCDYYSRKMEFKCQLL